MKDMFKDPLQLASLVAHQIKGPVAAVSSIVETLLGEFAGPISAKCANLRASAAAGIRNRSRKPGQSAPRLTLKCGQSVRRLPAACAIAGADSRQDMQFEEASGILRRLIPGVSTAAI